MCVGGVIIGNRVTIHTAAVLSHNVVIGDDARLEHAVLSAEK